MWVYRQSTGELFWNLADDPEQPPMAHGYSGFGVSKDHPNDEGVRDFGPIPRGSYTIEAPGFVTSPGPHGPYVLPLVPGPDNDMHGRSGFLIHGDSVEHPGTASHGCIILDRPTRERIWKSNDRSLTVVP